MMSWWDPVITGVILDMKHLIETFKARARQPTTQPSPQFSSTPTSSAILNAASRHQVTLAPEDATQLIKGDNSGDSEERRRLCGKI